MCVGLAGLGIIASIGSTVLGAVGTIQQASAASAQANYQAKVAANNATIANNMAKDTRDRGTIAEQQQRQQTKQLMGRQRAAMGANGVELGSGSALDVIGDTAQIGELDALTVRGNYEREALGYQNQAQNFKNDAAFARARASAAAAAGPMAAAGTILGGIGSVAQKWYQMG